MVTCKKWTVLHVKLQALFNTTDNSQHITQKSSRGLNKKTCTSVKTKRHLFGYTIVSTICKTKVIIPVENPSDLFCHSCTISLSLQCVTRYSSPGEWTHFHASAIDNLTLNTGVTHRHPGQTWSVFCDLDNNASSSFSLAFTCWNTGGNFLQMWNGKAFLQLVSINQILLLLWFTHRPCPINILQICYMYIRLTYHYM